MSCRRAHNGLLAFRKYVPYLTGTGSFWLYWLSYKVAPQGPGVRIPGCSLEKDLPLATRYYYERSCSPTPACKLVTGELVLSVRTW